MRVSRPCYDKYRRCPGWAGGGMKYAKVQRCDNGSLYLLDPHDDTRMQRAWKWRFHRCPSCGVVVLPYHVRKIDPTNWWSVIRVKTNNALWDWRNR